jgi:hypothetical protein
MIDRIAQIEPETDLLNEAASTKSKMLIELKHISFFQKISLLQISRDYSDSLNVLLAFFF